MVAAVAPSHSHRSSAGRSPAASPPLCSYRVRVDPVAASREADGATDKAATGRRPQRYRGPRDDEPRRRTTSPSVTMRRRRRDADREASPDWKRRRGSESASRTGYYRRDKDDDASHRRSRYVGHRAAKRRAPGGRKREGRRRRSSSSRSEERKAYHPSATDVMKPSPVEAVEKAEDAENEAKRRRERDELQRKRDEFRRELNKVVRTVWFNDPYISPLCELNKMPRWTLRASSELEEGEVV